MASDYEYVLYVAVIIITEELKGTSLKQYCLCCYVALCNTF